MSSREERRDFILHVVEHKKLNSIYTSTCCYMAACTDALLVTAAGEISDVHQLVSFTINMDKKLNYFQKWTEYVS